jgi:hypothetical protein
MIRKLAMATLLCAPAVVFANAADQPVLDACISSWGAKSPFKKGKAADATIGTGVKVFGLGAGQSGDDSPTEKPALILVRPAVNVAGKSTIRLNNPRGWYCFRSNVTVAGALHIDAHCKAQIASAKSDGTAVGAVDESGQGVAVFGALRINRFGCPEGKK